MLIGPLPDGGPLYKRVYDALRTKILRGELAAGARLPGTRTLARDLGVSRIVVLAAYEQLTAEGYIDAHVGAGSRVAVQGRGKPPPPPGRLKPAATIQKLSASAARGPPPSPPEPPRDGPRGG